jgi:glutathione S-transferase
MSRLSFYYHPFASYCQKALIALYEGVLAPEMVSIDLGNPEDRAALEAVSPMMRFPALVDHDAGAAIVESSIVIEYLGGLTGGWQAIPADPGQALAARMWDRTFDSYVMTPMNAVVQNRLRPGDDKDPTGAAQARAMLDRAYAMLEARVAERDAAGKAWIAADDFSLAECAAAPSLFYAERVHPFRDRFPKLSGYYQRLLDRPSFARVVEEAAFFMPNFPHE